MGVSLFAPRIAVDVIAVQLPKAGLVTRRELQRIHPFGGFPEVKVQTRRRAGPHDRGKVACPHN